MIRSIVFTALLLAPLAGAQPYRKPLKQAGDAFDDAASRARKASPACRQAVFEPLDTLGHRADDLKKDARAGDLMRLKIDAAAVASNAAWAGCPDVVVNTIHRGEDLLDEARLALFRDRREERRDDRDDRRGHHDDDDDQRWQQAQLSALQIQPVSTFEGERAVQVLVPELTLRNMQGQQFYLGARFKSFQGNWSQWVTTQQWSVPNDPFVWKNAFTHYFRYSTLAEQDFSGGRFVARVSLFDGRGRELAFREVAFTARLPQLPPAPPVVVVVPAPPPLVLRDCGTGPDVGCGLARDGRYPMDGTTFQGFIRSMQSTTSEMMRGQTAQSLFAGHFVTAVQFGLILDLFQSELTRMQVAQYGAPRVVNPEHTLGYADKFSSNLNRSGYTQLMARQPPSGQPVVVQPQMQPPMYGPRDCGTGPNDPGCTLQRNGRWAMDAPSWGGLYNSLRATANELTRQSMARQALGGQGLSAAQLGLLLDLFNNEIIRLDVAKFCAERVVNPTHAIGHSVKFRNGILAQEYVTVMGRQR